VNTGPISVHSKEAPDLLEGMLEDNKLRIPERVHQRLLNVLKDLRDDDFSGVSPEDIMKEIIKEYAED